MADDRESADDRSEDATPERRDEFRERGNVASSRELSSVLVLAGAIGFLTYFGSIFFDTLARMLVDHFQRIATFRVTSLNLFVFLRTVVQDTVILISPLFIIAAVIGSGSTLAQTRFNFSWERVKPDFNRIDPIQGMGRLLSFQSIVELIKGFAKLGAVSLVAYLVLKSVWTHVPVLMMEPVSETWVYWSHITENLFWGVASLLVFVAVLDFAHNFFSLEQKLKMTKKEVKEDFKRREVDPHIKARIKRMQREFSTRRVLDKTKKATVLITNPEHFAIAIRYELGMPAPVVVAKGIDFLALRMREIAKKEDIPIVENKPLARTLYKMVEADQEIPESLYKAVSEIIRYVFKLKGINLTRNKNRASAAA